jgi:signal transduction histidine kinase
MALRCATRLYRFGNLAMRLSEFIALHADLIVDEWERFAQTLTPAADTLNRAQLRDHAHSILLAAARDMDTRQSASEQAAKAKGEGPDTSPGLDQAAASHGELRHTVGFDLVQMTAEFRHLRACVLRLWVEHQHTPALADFQDMIRFNEAIDEALAESTAAYAEQVARSRDIFLAILGHDLRAPLQAVNMSTEMLLRKATLDSQGLSLVGNIKNGARHMGAMVNDLLEFVRSRLGSSLPIERKTMSLADAAQAAIDEARAGRPDCQPTLQVQGNALQHGTQQQAPTLTLKGQADSVVLSVHNYGPPIPQAALGTVFDPLVRGAGEALGSPSTSLGLGLFIVKEVVQAHGGSIDVTSSAADGTTFTVVLPRST